MVTILIAPVGLYVWRVLKGIKKFKPTFIYFILAKEKKEKPEWYKITSENLDFLKIQLGFPYEGFIETINVDFNDFNDVFVSVHKIIESELLKSKNDPPKFLFDITSAPLLPRMAFVNLAAIHKNVDVYYTPAENKLPVHYALDIVKEDKGLSPIKIPTVRSKTYDDIKENVLFQDILIAINSSKNSRVKSYANLMELINMDKTKRKNYMYLGRLLKTLKDMGIVSIKSGEGREKEVELTLLGKAVARTLM